MAQIITQISSDVEQSWQKELTQVITSTEKLFSLLNIDVNLAAKYSKARKLFPLRVPMPFVRKMKKGDIHDPLLQQVLPQAAEFEIVSGFSTDPLSEQNTKIKGLLHKYKNRVLLLVKTGCAVNCRYCFRRHFPYAENTLNKAALLDCVQHIAENSNIDEVILSGGDPLMANDDHLAWLLTQLESIEHVTRLRIHTRLPVVIPSRITQQLVGRLQQSRLKAAVVLHINHANEIDDELISALEPLKAARIPLFNQAVLLKGINDNVQTLKRLCETAFDAGIQPYYLYLLDKVQGAAHFEVAEADALALYQALLAEMSGFMVPRLVREIAGEANKTPINLP